MRVAAFTGKGGDGIIAVTNVESVWMSHLKRETAIAVETFSTYESSTIVLTVAILLYSATINLVSLPDLMVCLTPKPLPFPSKTVNPLLCS